MSDYEYEGRGGYPVFVIFVSLIVIAVISAAVGVFYIWPEYVDYQKNAPIQNEHSKLYLELDNSITKQLSNANITCSDIQSLREQHIVNKNWWEDPLGSDSNFDTARDLWNAKNCGIHWGWFES